MLKKELRDRIEELKSLKSGWLNGSGKPPNKEALDWLAKMFDTYEGALPDMYLYPTPEGCIEIEMERGELEIDIDIDLETKSVTGYVFDANGDLVNEFKVDLSDGDFRILLKKIRERNHRRDEQ